MSLHLDPEDFEKNVKWLNELANRMMMVEIKNGIHLDISYKSANGMLANHVFLDTYSDVIMFKEGMQAMYSLIANGGEKQVEVGK
jgi:hypothetical protein